MSQIQGKDTKPEMLVRKFLHSNGFRYRLHVKDLPGKPDLVLPKYNSVIFVHGCFWHGHDCKAGKLPNTRQEFWENRITNNQERDLRNKKELQKEGWNVLTVWECEIKPKSDRFNRLDKLVEQIKK